MTAEQRAEKIKTFSLLLPEKEQIALLDELTKRVVFDKNRVSHYTRVARRIPLLNMDI